MPDLEGEAISVGISIDSGAVAYDVGMKMKKVDMKFQWCCTESIPM